MKQVNSLSEVKVVVVVILWFFTQIVLADGVDFHTTTCTNGQPLDIFVSRLCDVDFHSGDVTVDTSGTIIDAVGNSVTVYEMTDGGSRQVLSVACPKGGSGTIAWGVVSDSSWAGNRDWYCSDDGYRFCHQFAVRYAKGGFVIFKGINISNWEDDWLDNCNRDSLPF